MRLGYIIELDSVGVSSVAVSAWHKPFYDVGEKLEVDGHFNVLQPSVIRSAM